MPVLLYRPAFSIHLDAIRGLAALAVFTGHARDLFIESPRAKLGLVPAAAGDAKVVQATSDAVQAVAHTSVGHQAVIIFFVLSGFLVGGGVLRAKRDGSWSWETYLSNRLTRLWMPLLPALLIGFLLDHFGLAWFDASSIYSGPSGQSEISPGLGDRSTWSVLLGNAFFLQGIIVPDFGTNIALWSLSYELWYYIAFPFLYLLVLSGISPAGRLGALVVLVAIGVFVGPAISLYFGIWLMGVALAAIPRLPWQSVGSVAVAVPAVLLFIAINGLLLKYPIALEQSDFVSGFVFSLLTYVILHMRDDHPQTLYARAAQGLSEMSYTLYLAHLPVLVLLCATIMTPWHRWPLDLLHVGLFFAILAAAFICCRVLWYCFERHTGWVRQVLRPWLAERAKKPAPGS